MRKKSYRNCFFFNAKFIFLKSLSCILRIQINMILIINLKKIISWFPSNNPKHGLVNVIYVMYIGRVDFVFIRLCFITSWWNSIDHIKTAQQHLKEATTFWSITNHDGINWILNQWDKLRHDVSLFAVSSVFIVEICIALYVQ